MTRRQRVRLILATHRLFKQKRREAQEALRASEKPEEETGAEMVADWWQGRQTQAQKLDGVLTGLAGRVN